MIGRETPESYPRSMPFATVGGFFDGPRPIVVGHRGDPARHRDNSLAGVMAGLSIEGAVEIDVRMTADGRLVLNHDHEIDGHVIAETSWDDLMRLPDDRRPIQLEDVISIPGRLDVEVKNLTWEPGFDPDGRVALMAASRLRRGDILTSFYWPDVDRVAQSTAVATGLVLGQDGSLEDAISHAASIGHVAVFAHESTVREDLVESGETAGVRVAVWTVNDVQRARELAGMGVAAIISDDPRSLSSVLRE